MKQKVFKSGNSLTVVIPADFARLVGVEAGDEVKVELNIRDGKLIYNFPRPRQLQLGS